MLKRRYLSITILLLLISIAADSQAPASSQKGYDDVLTYIDHTWNVLTRSLDKCETVIDKRVPEHSIMYLPSGFPEPEALKALAARCKLLVQELPERITAPGTFDVKQLKSGGVLYLPNPYVVPGGFFNEMYGWDSYFIIRGLLRDNRVALAQGMVENFFFEIEHYGSFLNANRTYFLTRSQPPFLSSMVMDVARELPESQRKAWFQEAEPYIERDYRMWTTGEHLAGDTGLSRYFDYGQGPVPEIADMHDPYYREVFTYIQASPERHEYLQESGSSHQSDVTGPVFTFRACEQDAAGCLDSPSMRFTSDYYQGDRAMRESGYDISFRFGAFGGSTHHFAPVCLNSLLYKTETDMQEISTTLANGHAAEWQARAQHRKTLMTQYFWDQKAGMFYDYDFTRKKRSTYDYVTVFFPLWVGAASPEQARAVIANLKIFERPGGVRMSPYETGVQWDAPYGWAPNQLPTVEGLRRYGAKSDADRVAKEWVDTVAADLRKEGTIREKYNVEIGSSEANVIAGYKQNQVGFGWTNGVTLEFLHQLGMIKPRTNAEAAK
jgi:alpha,alpha-trehalase